MNKNYQENIKNVLVRFSINNLKLSDEWNMTNNERWQMKHKTEIQKFEIFFLNSNKLRVLAIWTGKLKRVIQFLID